ncbi:MAG TPA: GAF domain-containing protein [candidate division Zixibacteria bacterium]|nr:GAF domain-containing protein [candidate division Zixibacteria bacterium]
MTNGHNAIPHNLLSAIKNIVAGSEKSDAKLQEVCDLLRQSIPGYDWVGFYLVDPVNDGELILGPYAGEPTEHVRINFGQGICGQAAEKEETIIVDDVASESNYLSCNINVKSEIVLPIFKNNKIIGELDLDSHTTGRFDKKDREFLSKVIEIIVQLF